MLSPLRQPCFTDTSGIRNIMNPESKVETFSWNILNPKFFVGESHDSVSLSSFVQQSCKCNGVQVFHARDAKVR